jgi:hypothetical protein
MTKAKLKIAAALYLEIAGEIARLEAQKAELKERFLTFLPPGPTMAGPYQITRVHNEGGYRPAVTVKPYDVITVKRLS